MIYIKEESSQKLFGITNGCCSCSTNDYKHNDIRIIKIDPDADGCGLEIPLCRGCREKLQELLSK